MNFICNLCNFNEYILLFFKSGKDQKIYKIVQCKKCKVVQTFPQPQNTSYLYSSQYFTTRTDRGYHQYFSEKTKKELLRIWDFNLKDLNFYELEKKIFQYKKNPKLLEIGSAAGFFLEFMKNRGWDVTGVEISEYAANYAKNQFQINIIQQDFTKLEINNSFDLIVLWATIEHFPNPYLALQKINDYLTKGGYVILSTCRWGILASILKTRWRFMNVPEHLYFFTKNQLINLFKQINFELIAYKTYGSGLTSKENAGRIYKLIKYFADRFVKLINEGDMMILLFQKN